MLKTIFMLILMILFYISGVYLISWKLAPSTVGNNTLALLKLNQSEIGRMMLSPGNSDTITLTMRIDLGSILDWSTSYGSFSQVYQSLSLIKLGD